MLYLIGTGIWRWNDISVRGLDICERANTVYLDGYTRFFEQSELESLEKRIGKKITVLNRKELEEELHFLNNAKENDIVLLVPGDPLLATTHITIVMQARKKGVKTEIVHSSNIHAALIGEAGLHMYKLGGSCTIPMSDKMIKPYSTYDKIADNMKRKLHTLVFLDTSPSKQMTVQEAISILEEIESEKQLGVCNEENRIVVGCRVGSTDQKIVYTTIKRAKQTEFAVPCTLVFPGELHFSEEEFLKTIEL